MKHSFDVEIARKYDIPTAVLLENLFFWIEKNKANNRHFHDGHYWTYNSIKAFVDLFPYLTERQIRYTLQKMIDNKLIITGNYNESQYDRTLWYAITDFGYCILQNCQMDNTKDKNDEKSEENPDNSHFTKLSNGISSSVRPIPDNKPNINNNDILIYCNRQKSSSNMEYEIDDEDENEEIKTNYSKIYPPKGTSYNEKHQRTQMILNQGLDPKLYDQLRNLIQRLYYDKTFTPEECIILSEKLTKLDEEFDYIYVAKALSYTLSHSKSKRIKNRCGYILASLRDSIENIIISEKERAKSPEQRMRELEESIRECYYKHHGNELASSN